MKTLWFLRLVLVALVETCTFSDVDDVEEAPEESLSALDGVDCNELD